MIVMVKQDTLDVVVQLGPMEAYLPTKEIKEIFDRAQALKKTKDQFIEDVFNPEVKKILDLVDSVNRTNNPSLGNKQP